MEYIQIRNNEDIESFMDRSNGLHDGYIIGVEFINNGITPMETSYGHEFDYSLNELRVRILVTSICDTVIELCFEEIRQWQIKYDGFDIIDTSVSIAEDGLVTWTDEPFAAGEDINKSSYIVAGTMKWRIVT